MHKMKAVRGFDKVDTDSILSEQFSEIVSLCLFGMQVEVAHNDVIGVATFGRSGNSSGQ